MAHAHTRAFTPAVRRALLPLRVAAVGLPQSPGRQRPLAISR